MHKNKLWFFLLLVLLALRAQAAPVPDFIYTREENGASYVLVPQVSGMVNTFAQDNINNSIVRDGGYELYLANLRTIGGDSAAGIQVDATASFLPGAGAQDVLTVRIEASGRIGPGRPSHQSRGLMYFAATGLPISADAIFRNPQEAVGALQTMLEQSLAKDTGGYLDASGFFPIPMDNILMDEYGITFFYNHQAFSLLSGKSASLYLHYNEIAHLLLMEEGTLLHNLGFHQYLQPGPGSKDAITKAAAQGRLPGIPVPLGAQAQDVFSAYPRAMDSESFPGGLRYQLEDDRFRGTQLIVSRGEVAGLISKRMNLYGLVIGTATLEDAQRVLGESNAVLPLDEAAALQYSLPTGSLHDFVFDLNTLRLLFSPDGVLQAIWLSQAAQP